jgi:hypothetical protein
MNVLELIGELSKLNPNKLVICKLGDVEELVPITGIFDWDEDDLEAPVEISLPTE